MNRNAKSKAIFVSVLFVLTIFGQMGTNVQGHADVLSVNYNFDMPAIEIQDGVATISLKDCYMENDPGKPMIPVYTARILIPAGKDVRAIAVSYGKPILINEDVTLKHGQPPVIIGEEGQMVPRDEKIYGSKIGRAHV